MDVVEGTEEIMEAEVFIKDVGCRETEARCGGENG